ncbi:MULTISPECIES: hypothetical protein [Gemmobacter]|uniref:50S ribosomal protein L35 n=2 Tax=Gemmobacter TaxID=204456 RepID=A0A2T6B686_9RHOB|nr:MULTISPECIES: hypothetical protein [Gemmobacter]OJY33450.1 MAG: hypothetical protein BGP11_21450 [Rhodobacterales bacterium 65-51]PTX51568.1 hypothetical protein C8N34_10369 [Gemmobacter caeni]TWJ03696.1 hypothetical protein IQ03_00650 [Gemmobacter caeni]GHC13105.1 hypothetical protein GCM10007291_08150 [Gemmobacter nanjingensis]
MNPDLLLVIGIVLAVLAVPAMVSAFSDGRAPRAASITVLIAGVLIVFAFTKKPGGYEVRDIPNAFYRVIGQFRH